MRQIKMSLAIFIVVASAVTQAQTPGAKTPVATAAELRAQRAGLTRQIEILNETLTCTTASDCESIEIGEKPCGGPVSYLITSQLNPNTAQMRKLAEQVGKIDKAIALSNESGLVSDCRYLDAPKLACEKERCAQVKSPNSAPR